MLLPLLYAALVARSLFQHSYLPPTRLHNEAQVSPYSLSLTLTLKFTQKALQVIKGKREGERVLPKIGRSLRVSYSRKTPIGFHSAS